MTLAAGAYLRAIVALQVANSLLSAASAFVLFHILRFSIRSAYLCATLTLLFAFSATWWKFSTDANAYIPSVLFLLVSFYLTHPARQPRSLLVALTYSVSMFFHQLALIFFPVLALGIFLQSSEIPFRRRIALVMQFGAVAFLITLTTFYFCFHLREGRYSPAAFARWLTWHSPDSGFTFDARRSLFYTLRGQAQLFFGGRFNHVKGLVNPYTTTLIALLAASSLALAWKILRHFGELKSSDRAALEGESQRASLLRLSLLWVAVYLAFLFFWMPQHTFYRLFYLPGIILLCGLLLARYESGEGHARRYRLALLVVVVALANFLFFIYPYSHAQKNPPLALALKMNEVWRPATVIYYASSNTDNRLFRYFNPATEWKQLSSFEPERMEDELRDLESRGQSAWLETSALDLLQSSPGGPEWLQLHTIGQPKYELVEHAYRIIFFRMTPAASPADGGPHE